MKNKGILKAIIRGILKGLPAVNPVIETIENVKNIKDLKTEVSEEVKVLKHSWVSITIQFIIVGVTIYAFVSKQITIEKLIELVGGF